MMSTNDTKVLRRHKGTVVIRKVKGDYRWSTKAKGD